MRVSCSVRWTSKSDGASRTPAIAGRRPRGRRVLLAPQGVEQRAAQVEVERVAEFVRLGRLVALPAPTATIQAVPAEGVALEPREQVVEHLLADLAAAARRQLEALAIAGQVAGLLQTPGQVVQRVELAASVVAQQVADLVAIDPGQVPRRVHVRQGVLQPVERPEPRDLGQRAVEAERLVPAERHPVAETARQQEVQVRGELGEVDQQPVVAQQRIHHRLELGPLGRAHRPQERLHGRHPLGELVDDVVERLRAGEERPVLGQELRRIRIATADPLPDQLVEVTDHRPVGGQVLGAHRPDGVGHARHELVEDLLLESLDELVEALSRGRLEEVVVLQATDPVAHVGGQAVELVQSARRDVAQHRAQVRVGLGIRPGRLVEPALDAGPLLGHDLVELAPDVAEDVAELVLLEELLPLALEPFHEVLQAGHVTAGRVACPPAAFHQPAERLGEVALGHDVVGQRIEDLVRVEVGDDLAAVPARVARRPGDRLGRRVAAPAGDVRPQVPRVRGVRGHRW